MSLRLLRLKLLTLWNRLYLKSTAKLLLLLQFCLKNIPLVIFAIVFLIFLWAIYPSTNSHCNQDAIKSLLCQEYKDRLVDGDLCESFCSTGQHQFRTCFSMPDGTKLFKNYYHRLMYKLSLQPDSDALEPWTIQEGLKVVEFRKQIKDYLVFNFGRSDFTPLINRFFSTFDKNKDTVINLGEAQNLWRLLHQPLFLKYFMFQGSSGVPQLNGSCGGMSVWRSRVSSRLYERKSFWFINLISRNAYRWSLPLWVHRAQIAMGILEFVEDIYEKDGIRFFLCDVTSRSLQHVPSYEFQFTPDVMLVSSHEIEQRLSNRTCTRNHDCTFTPQCVTQCNYKSGRCTGIVKRPTLSRVCDIIEDYLLFDTPLELKGTLLKLLLRCQSLDSSHSKVDLEHSVLLVDLKSVLWRHVQHLKPKKKYKDKKAQLRWQFAFT